jgi:cob(I)alamin adenosyltransferase
MTDQPPVESPIPDDLRSTPSLVLVNTGDGKGKSTAAMGTIMRAVARGWRVACVQFIKSGEWKSGEEKIGRQLGVDWDSVGDGFSWDAENLDRSAALARQAWDLAAGRINSGDYHLVVLDEITYPMTWGWIDTDDVIETIRRRPEHVSLILTGRDAPQALVDVADTVTFMTNVKHAYQAGIRAKKGIDY